MAFPDFTRIFDLLKASGRRRRIGLVRLTLSVSTGSFGLPPSRIVPIVLLVTVVGTALAAVSSITQTNRTVGCVFALASRFHAGRRDGNMTAQCYDRNLNSCDGDPRVTDGPQSSPLNSCGSSRAVKKTDVHQ
jgi:hypothetical protein